MNANPEERKSPLVTATGLQVAEVATTAFDGESIRLEPVDRDDLPPHENATAAGDGLNVSGPVDGPVQLELGVDADDETVDLWHHDGSVWETVEEDLAVSGGAVEMSVDRNGTYATGTEADGSDGIGDDSDGSDGSDDSGDDSDSSDGTGDDFRDGSDLSDDETATPTQTRTPSDGDGVKDTPTTTPADSDDEKTETPTDSNGSTDCGCTASDDEDDETTSADETTASPQDHQQADGTTADGQTTDGDDSLADGPGFGPVVALVALVGGALLMRWRG